jgi:hypothetical protein
MPVIFLRNAAIGQPRVVDARWRMPYRHTKIDPPIVVSVAEGDPVALSTIEQVIDYVRLQTHRIDLKELRDAAFVAAAIPSAENIETLRRLTDTAFRAP